MADYGLPPWHSAEAMERMAKVEVVRERLGDLLADIWTDHEKAIDAELDCDSYGRQLLATTRPEFDDIAATALAELAEQYEDTVKHG